MLKQENVENMHISVRKEFALNKRGSNLKLIRQVNDGVLQNSGTNQDNCEQNWVEQNADQFEIAIANAYERGNERAHSAYESKQQSFHDHYCEVEASK